MKENLTLKGQLRGYLAWPLFLALFPLAGNAAVAMISASAAAVLCPFTIGYLAAALWIYWYRRKRVLGGLVEFSAQYAWIQKQLLDEMVIPDALADEDGRILWMNQAFQEVLDEGKVSRRNLTSIFPEVTRADLAVDDETVHVHSVFGEYRFGLDIRPVYLSNNESEEKEATTEREKMLAVYLFDETESLRYRQLVTEEKLVAGVIYLDNYDEALESVEEVRRSLLTALIDRKINKFISGVEGIVKKIEKDKYFFIVKQKHILPIHFGNA